MKQRRRGKPGMVLALAMLAAVWSGAAQAAAEVKLDRDFIAGLIEKLPEAKFSKDGQYRGAARKFRLDAIDPVKRRFIVGCEVTGEFRPPIAGALRRAITPPTAKVKPASNAVPAPAPIPTHDDVAWKSFTFDVRASIRAEPGRDGVPRFWVDVDEVKRRELEGMAGALAKALGRRFDEIVTQVADGKASTMNAKLNAQLQKKVASFREYGVLREVDYTTDQVVLTFDVTRYRSDGIAGYVFDSPQPGTVPLHRWVRPGPGDHFYTISTRGPAGHPYYVYEAVAGHVFAGPEPGTVPLNRWRGPREWFYTTAPDGERFGQLGYRAEAVACHVYPEPTAGAVPLYRFVDPHNGSHFYSTHPHAEFAK